MGSGRLTALGINISEEPGIVSQKGVALVGERAFRFFVSGQEDKEAESFIFIIHLWALSLSICLPVVCLAFSASKIFYRRHRTS